MKSEFENSIKLSSSYEKIVYQHGERLFIFDDGKYKIAAVQLAWEIFKEKQNEVYELQKRVDAAQKLIDDWNFGGVHIFDLLDELEQALKGGGE